MASSINTSTSNWQYTGSNVSIPQASFTLSIDWVDNDGVTQTWTDTVVWPNDFSFLGVDLRRRIIEELTIRIARVRLGIDSELEA